MLHEVRHMRGSSGSGIEDATATPSPNLLVSSETVSHSSVSPAKSTSTRMRDSTSHHRVTIDESSLPQHSHGGGGGGGSSNDGDSDDSGGISPSSSSQPQLSTLVGVAAGAGDGDERQTGHLALMYHSHQLSGSNFPVLPAIKRTHRPSFMYPPMPRVKA